MNTDFSWTVSLNEPKKILINFDGIYEYKCYNDIIIFKNQ